MIWIKIGVIGDLQTPARKCLGRIANLFASKGVDLFITSIREGNHSPGSLHYDGLAFDFRWDSRVTVQDIIRIAGPGFDVVEHKSHIHVEYDPK